MKIFAGLALFASLAVMSFNANAVTLNVGLTDPNALGTVIPGNYMGPGGGQLNDDSNDVATVLGLSPSTSITIGNNTFTRSANPFSSTPAVTTSGALYYGSGGNAPLVLNGNYVQITLTVGYTYLVAKWDGMNSGAEVWDIANLSAGTVIDIPYDVNVINGQLVPSDKYALTSWTLLDQTQPNGGGGPLVPDGGSTIIMVGSALTGLAFIGRRIRKS